VKIREIKWSNYRRLADAHLAVRDHLVLVGPNDSGKSSALRAVHLCLGVPGNQLSSAIQIRDLTFADKPLVLEVILDGFCDDERAAFPDEIDTGPPETLTVRLEARIDPDDPKAVVVERGFPFAGHSRKVSRTQFEAIGWGYVAATRSLIRELGSSSGGAAHDLLSGLDLSADSATFSAAQDTYRDALAGSTAITDLRGALASALTAALPEAVDANDVGVSSAADLLDNPLAGVSITIRDGGHTAQLAEQSDGVRALSVLALLGLSQQNAQIVGIDEPETHLHTTAQRAVADSIRRGGGQRVISTHSSAIVSRMNPLDIAAFGADRRIRQLPAGAHIAELEVSARHWGHRMIEPLTAKRIVLVEGVSDRIIVVQAAELLGLNLDRSGVAIFELDGAGLFSTANKLFGKPGFDLPLYGLVDSDAADAWAEELGITRTDFKSAGMVESVPDLEGNYVAAFGAARVAALLVGAGMYSEQQILRSCKVTDPGLLTDALMAGFCRHRKRKTKAAIAVAYGMTPAEAQAISSVGRLLTLVSRERCAAGSDAQAGASRQPRTHQHPRNCSRRVRQDRSARHPGCSRLLPRRRAPAPESTGRHVLQQGEGQPLHPHAVSHRQRLAREGDGHQLSRLRRPPAACSR
jgi:putative ATP-dependent endonuclease of the OLD family